MAHDIFETRMQHQLPNSAFAILYRTNAQSRSMEEALRKLNIPTASTAAPASTSARR